MSRKSNWRNTHGTCATEGRPVYLPRNPREISTAAGKTSGFKRAQLSCTSSTLALARDDTVGTSSPLLNSNIKGSGPLIQL
ncbi:hypothetical protein G7K_4351-t1 [Saitoella complicata NRRL Y-17804]|uniref:Uncharacterized protein n=1 Tax=Saitoella complicata (strain BCRC 22490 / CBS 7301 / JCM 7358 / NBRC 10748 / NRRL Y-17804) TaxID=698492 RepID=A0A0E9NK49_SAICN|nr:hypothetical protein G7K_4351-t1 [Saitoella complicata NRRL Y-17804]